MDDRDFKAMNKELFCKVKVPKLTSYEKIEALCSKEGLSDSIKEQIRNISKESYIQGSNDCYNIWVKK
jgi:hypothetical protein